VLFFEQMSSLPDNLLERADRMTMDASVEARAPFLDHGWSSTSRRCPTSCACAASRPSGSCAARSRASCPRERSR
jgi:asparagine synthase (glutamine-hydrolysing)